MFDSIHAALWEWFSGCGLISQLFFNFGEAQSDSIAIATAGDTVLKNFIDGSQRRRYAFELVIMLPAAFAPNDPSNVDMIEQAEAIAQWIQQQNDDGNLPRLPPGRMAEEISILEESFAYVEADDQNLARYMIPFALDYMKDKP